MKPETARRQIIDYTKREMVLHGVSRLTMDTISQSMGMSKRTLYQLFPSKVCLVRICLAEFTAEKRNRLLMQQEQEEHSSTESLFRTMDAYTALLHSLDRTLLSDLAEDTDYQPVVEREKTFWLQQLADALNLCKACGVLLPDVNPDRLAIEVLTLLYENCLRGASYATQRLLSYSLLRGFFKIEDIRYIDECLPIY
ncbi:TetR/AcrR family transcriptional regulator [Bacteroides sp.]